MLLAGLRFNVLFQQYSIVFLSNQDDGMMIMKGFVQRRPVYGCFHRELNLRPLDQQASA